MKRESKLLTPRTAHYYALGEPGPKIKTYWLACHGYGHLAGDFINDFIPISNEETLIVAPEALNKFYWNGFGGPPVASWMTRHQRLDEIEDYVNYLQTLHRIILAQLLPEVKVILFGFSQGVATICRFIERRQPHFHELVFWAGRIPDDLTFEKFGETVNQRPVHVVLGNADPFVTPEGIAEQRQFIEAAGLNICKLDFEGKHHIPESVIIELSNRL